MFSIRKALGMSGVVVALMAVSAAPALAAPGIPAPSGPSQGEPAFALGFGGVSIRASVVAQTFANPNGTQSFGSVQCPVNRVRSGGGVFGSSGFHTAGQQSVNSSYPIGPRGWAAYMNNETGSASSFTVYTVCLRR